MLEIAVQKRKQQLKLQKQEKREKSYQLVQQKY